MDIDSEEGFEVVKRKGRPSPLAPEGLKSECLILTEEELNLQSNRMNWRKVNTDTPADLFRVQHDRQEFPKVFQNYKPPSEIKKETPFTFMKQKQVRVSKMNDTHIGSLQKQDDSNTNICDILDSH